MNIVMTLVGVVQVLAALGVIGLVLMQHGKGADMGAAFGSGSSGSLFGASGSANFLSRATAVLAALFFIATLTLSFFANRHEAASSGGSVMDRAPIVAPPGDSAPPRNNDIPTPGGPRSDAPAPSSPTAGPAAAGSAAAASAPASAVAPASAGAAGASSSAAPASGATAAPSSRGSDIPK